MLVVVLCECGCFLIVLLLVFLVGCDRCYFLVVVWLVLVSLFVFYNGSGESGCFECCSDYGRFYFIVW